MTETFTYNPTKGPKWSFLRDDVSSNGITGLNGTTGLNENLHQLFTLSHKIGSISFNGSQDILDNNNPNVNYTTTTTDVFHFNTTPGKKFALVGDWHSQELNNGTFNSTDLLTLNYNLKKTLALLVDHAENVANNGVTVTNLMNTSTDVVTNDVGLAGKVFGKMTLTGKFGSTQVNSTSGNSTGQTQVLSLAPDNAKDMGTFKQVKWNLSLAQVETNGQMQTAKNGITLSSVVKNNTISLQYMGALASPSALPTSARGITIAGDPNPKNKFHYTLAYKVRNPTAGGAALTVAKYTADLQVNPLTKLVYSFNHFNERADGGVDLMGAESLQIQRPVVKNVTLVSQWASTSNHSTNSGNSTMSLGFTDKLSSLTSFAASYGFTDTLTSGVENAGHTATVKYDWKLNDDHLLSLSGQYNDNPGSVANQRPQYLQFSIDFKTVFN
jgi:hypothetical protein